MDMNVLKQDSLLTMQLESPLSITQYPFSENYLIFNDKDRRWYCPDCYKKFGLWKGFGIKNWDDLFKTAFETINKERKKERNILEKKGLERAKKESPQFKKKVVKYQHLKIKG